jgi:hypothetical protein
MTTAIKPTPPEEALLRRCQRDPVVFFREFLGCNLFPLQQNIIRSVARNRRTAVVGANSTGKDYTTGRLILWWLNCFYPSKVILTGPTHRQVQDIVWREARSGFRTRIAPLAGQMYGKDARYEIDDEWFAIGFATDDPNHLQGFHSPHLMVIVTEAHGFSQPMMEAVKRLNPEKLVLTGNPLALGGEFYDSFHSNTEMYSCIHISALETPNILEGRVVIPGMVTLEDIEERRQEWGEESPMYLASVLGQFPDNLDDAIVPLTAAMDAVRRESTADGPAILGVDVSREGQDSTVFYRRQGPVARKVYKTQGKDLMRVVGEIMRVIDADREIKTVVIDDTGLGGGVTDRLRELRPDWVRIMPFIGGSKAKDTSDFFNAIAEAWWSMGKAFRGGTVDIEEDKPLIAQITTRQYTIQSDKTIRLESKDDVKKRGGKSPDEGDALAMTYSPLVRMPLAWTPEPAGARGPSLITEVF